MKKRDLLIGAVVLILLIILLAFYSRDYFNSHTPKVGENKLKIELSGDQVLNLTDKTPVDENNIDSVVPYIFKVKNNGNTKEKYEIGFEDFASDDGKEHLDRTYLKYQLKSDSNIIKSGKLTDIKNNIITKDEINPKTTKKYELRIWVDASISTSEWFGKSYSYNVMVNQMSK